jgi:hypothetical protein
MLAFGRGLLSFVLSLAPRAFKTAPRSPSQSRSHTHSFASSHQQANKQSTTRPSTRSFAHSARRAHHRTSTPNFFSANALSNDAAPRASAGARVRHSVQAHHRPPRRHAGEAGTCRSRHTANGGREELSSSSLSRPTTITTTHPFRSPRLCLGVRSCASSLARRLERPLVASHGRTPTAHRRCSSQFPPSPSPLPHPPLSNTTKRQAAGAASPRRTMWTSPLCRSCARGSMATKR